MPSINLIARGNEAVKINAPVGLDFHITEHGSDWLWAAFCVFAATTLVTVGLSYRKHREERIFHYSTCVSLFIMSILYFTMASNLGWAGSHAIYNHITVEGQKEFPGVRQVFYARYVAWFLSFPAFFLNFAGLSCLPWSTTLFTIVAQNTCVITLLVGSVVSSTYKWGYFAFCGFAYFLVCYNLLVPFRRAAAEVNSETHKHMTIIACASILLFLLYQICWALCEGANVIQPDSEAVFYGVLDICFFCIIGMYLLFATKNIDFVASGIRGNEDPVFHHHYSRALNYANEKIAQPVGDDAHPTATAATDATEHAKETV